MGWVFDKRAFIHEIEDKYDLERWAEIYLQYFMDWCYKTKHPNLLCKV